MSTVATFAPLTSAQGVDGMRSLPSLPAVVLELLRSIHRDAASVPFLAEKISHDLTLAAKVLRLDNSSFYGTALHVAKIRQVIALLGLYTVRSLVLAATLTASYGSRSTPRFDYSLFWRRVISTVVCARRLAPLRCISSNMACIASLLHDIGHPEMQATIDARHMDDGGNIRDAERAVTGTDRAAIGAALVTHWHFRIEITHAVAQDASRERALAAVVQLADLLAQTLELDGNSKKIFLVDTALHQQIGVSTPQLDWMITQIESERLRFCRVLVQ